MNDLLLRPEQDVTVLKAENDPVQKVEVKRVNKADAGRVIDPVGLWAMQRQQQAAQQAPLTSFGGLGAGLPGYYGGDLGAQRYVPSPLAAALGRIGC